MKNFRRRSLFIFTITLLFAAHALASTKPKITGTWRLNRDASTDGRSELPGLSDVSDLQSTLAKTVAWYELETDPRMTELLEATELLEIYRDGSVVSMNAVGGTNIVLTRALFTDGRASTQRFGILSGNTIARWDGDILRIDTSDSTGHIIRETYEVSPDGTSLHLSITIEHSEWSSPVQIERIYDRIN